MIFQESIYKLWLKLKFVTISLGKLNAIWKRCPNRMNPSCEDVVCAISVLGLGAKMFLVNLDTAGSLDQADRHNQ